MANLPTRRSGYTFPLIVEIENDTKKLLQPTKCARLPSLCYLVSFFYSSFLSIKRCMHVEMKQNSFYFSDFEFQRIDTLLFCYLILLSKFVLHWVLYYFVLFYICFF